jgi:hypothetical protein
MKTYHDIKSAATIDAMIPYIETLLDIRFKRVKNKWSSNTLKNSIPAALKMPRKRSPCRFCETNDLKMAW